MNAKRLGLALLVAVVLATAAWWLEVEKPRRDAAAAEARARLIVDGDSMSEFVVERSGETYTLRPVGDGTWSVQSSTLPDRTLVADMRAVEMVAEGLERARLEDLMTEEEASGSLADFGLDSERLRLTWSSPDGTRSLLFGALVPPDGERVYGLIEGRLVTFERQLAARCAWGLDHWRLKSLLHFQTDELLRIEIERPLPRPPGISPRVVLGVDPHPRGARGWWRVLEPVDAPARPDRTRSYLSLLQRLQADSFLTDMPSDLQLVDAGLDPPRAIVTLHFTNGETKRLLLGEPRELTEAEKNRPDGKEVLAPIHARLDDGPIVFVRPDLLSSLLVADAAWRDNRALPMPLLRITSFRYVKELDEGEPIVLEIQRELEGSWTSSRPAHADLPDDDVRLMLGVLQAVQFGRFEDEIAADPSGFETAYDLQAPETFTIEAQALDPEGRPVSVLIEAGPPGAIMKDRDPYRPVRITDQAGRRTVGVAKFRAFDKFLERQRELRLFAEEHGQVVETP